MNTDFASSFDNDVKKIIDAVLIEKIHQAIETIENAVSKKDISALKKLKGYKIFYRIKIGRYRIGVSIEGDLVTFLRFLPRKDFYKYFP